MLSQVNKNGQMLASQSNAEANGPLPTHIHPEYFANTFTYHLDNCKYQQRKTTKKVIILMIYLKHIGKEQCTFKKSFFVPWIVTSQ